MGAFDSAQALRELLGSFWTHIYDDRRTVGQLLWTRVQREAETVRLRQDAQRCLSVDTIPIFRQVRAERWLIRESVLREVSQRYPRYGEGFLYNDDRTFDAIDLPDFDAGPEGDGLQLESGGFLLLENGGYLLLEEPGQPLPAPLPGDGAGEETNTAGVDAYGDAYSHVYGGDTPLPGALLQENDGYLLTESGSWLLLERTKGVSSPPPPTPGLGSLNPTGGDETGGDGAGEPVQTPPSDLSPTQPPVAIRYGTPADGRPRFLIPVPARFRGANWIANRQHDPSLVWAQGADYGFDAERGVLEFFHDPFTQPFAVRQIYNEQGQPVDRELCFWVCEVRYERQYLQQHAGYLFDTQLPSSHNARELLRSFVSLAATHVSPAQLLQAVAAIADVPITAEQPETVQVVAEDAYGWLVATDRQAYRLTAADTPGVQPGQQLPPYTTLGTGLRFYSLRNGQPAPELSAIPLDSGFLPDNLRGHLNFLNREVPVEIRQERGFTHLRFEVAGWADDVQLFWQQIEQAGEQLGETLADLLDTEPTATEPPGAARLPKTINPAHFVATHFLRSNVYVLCLRPHVFGPSALPSAMFAQLRELLPANSCLIIVSQLEAGSDSVTMEQITETPQSVLVVSQNETVALSAWTERSYLTLVDTGGCLTRLTV